MPLKVLDNGPMNLDNMLSYRRQRIEKKNKEINTYIMRESLTAGLKAKIAIEALLCQQFSF